MGFHDLLIFSPLLAALLYAAIEDIAARRIRNVLTFSIAAAGLLQAFLPMHALTPLQSIEGIGIGLSLMLIPFGMGALGGGDVKLLAAVGAWVGPMDTLNVFLIAAIIGMVIVITQALYQRRLTRLVRNSFVLAISLAHVNELGVDHVADVGAASAVDKPLPYAVPILLATLCTLVGFQIISPSLL